MNITVKHLAEYRAWCTDNHKKGYTYVDKPDFIEFMAWMENTYPQGE